MSADQQLEYLHDELQRLVSRAQESVNQVGEALANVSHREKIQAVVRYADKAFAADAVLSYIQPLVDMVKAAKEGKGSLAKGEVVPHLHAYVGRDMANYRGMSTSWKANAKAYEDFIAMSEAFRVLSSVRGSV